MPLAEALQRLGIHWQPIGGKADDEPTRADAQSRAAIAVTTYEDAQLLVGADEGDEAVWRRAVVLCTLGLIPSAVLDAIGIKLSGGAIVLLMDNSAA
eukprot:208530-Pleurochrysis_carterae.AAC.3